MNKANGIYSAIVAIILLIGLLIGCGTGGNRVPGGDVEANKPMVYLAVKDVKVNDSFWSPKLNLWNDITVNDVFNKFEGKYDAESQPDLLNDFKKSGKNAECLQ